MLQHVFEKEIFVEEVKRRCSFFRDVQVFPVANNFNYEGWLRNFKNLDELYLASVILGFFNYYSKEMVNKLLYDAVGKVGIFLSSQRKNWHHDHFKTNTFYSFIPGERESITDSGFIFSKKVRDELHIPEDHLIDFFKIPNLLANIGKAINIIFVDDFIGSGCQCIDAMTEDRFKNGHPLYDIIAKGPHLFAYAPIIANKSGVERIRCKCPLLYLAPAHILGNEYNLFNPTCICWENDDELFHAGTKLIIEKSLQLGIPNTDGADTRDTKGFGGQGLAIAFEHGVPDAVPAFFYFNEKNWTPLVKREYKRLFQ